MNTEEQFEKIWQSVAAMVSTYSEVAPSQVDAFFSRVHIQAMSGDFLVITAETDFIKDWVEKYYFHYIQRALKEMFGGDFTILFETCAQAPSGAVQAPAVGVTAMPTPAQATPRVENTEPSAAASLVSAPETHDIPDFPAQDDKEEEFNDNEKDQLIRGVSPLTFENFVIGNSNQMAYKMALAVAEAPGKKVGLNPLFIYGKSGLGKTHLLRAIENQVLEAYPNFSVVYVDSSEFLDEYTEASAAHDKNKHSFNNFKKRYEEADVLLIDDVQFFGSKDATKMEIFNTFNDLFDKKKHIIMTSDRTPQDIDKLEDRLQTRFSSGLVAPISPPDYEICCIILQQRAEKLGITLPKDVVDYIASHINTNVRELEGAFNKLVTFSQIKKQTITLAFTKDALKDQIPLDNRQELTVDFIIDTVCQYYGVKKDKLLGRGRPQKIVIPRQIAMYMCRNELNESYPTLRDYFHRKDHSTVLYACERVEKDIERDPQTRASIEAIRKLLKQRG